MYNLQKAREDIDAVAKHAVELTEHVIAIGDMLQELSSNIEVKLRIFRTEMQGGMDGKLDEMKKTVLGSEGPLVETSAIADLGAKLSALKNHPSVLAAREEAGTKDLGEAPQADVPHPVEHPPQDYHEGHNG